MAAAEAPTPAKNPPEPFKKNKKGASSGTPWVQSISSEDPFSVLLGSSEGGFMSLDEIDGSELGLITGVSEDNGGEVLRKLKKRKRKGGDDAAAGAISVAEEVAPVIVKKKNTKKKKKKRKKDKSKVVDEADVEKSEDAGEFPAGSSNEDEMVTNEDEYWAWKELRLHPLLMKAVYKLGFKEPTPIQKACIPVAAHRGKDVIGAAETGSGKTLAFGLPILQRLLEEREKSEEKTGKETETVEEVREERPLRALIVTPTRELALQICSHLREIAMFSNIYVAPIVGGIYTKKQERILEKKPEIVVGTPGRLWELMKGDQRHLVELESLSFFVLDEADRMVEKGHFRELKSIIDRLPRVRGSVEENSPASEHYKTVLNIARKKRQTFVFSATIALSSNFRKKLKHGSVKSKSSLLDGVDSLETLSQLAGIRVDAAVVDLTSSKVLAHKLEESFIECKEEDKEAYLYYLLSVHGQGRTIVFCTSIAALRRISSLMRIVAVNVWTLHAQMQQRARLKAMEHFRESENGTLIATDVAARGLDIPGVRTVVHFQLPHSAEVYVHRSGRTARAAADGCSIALISPKDKLKFASLCKSFSKDTLQRFPVNDAYMREVLKRLSLARQIDKVLRKNSHETSEKSWLERNAKSVELSLDDRVDDEEQSDNHKRKKVCTLLLKKLQQELNEHLAQPLQPKTFSRRYLAGAGVSPLLQQQLKELAQNKAKGSMISGSGRESRFVVIGQQLEEPLEALRSGGQEVSVGMREINEKMEIKNKQKMKQAHKKRLHEQRRKQRRKMNE